jgi:selenocysteine-specific elongation factor
MPTVVVGTAGHIDHGKTTLLRALTGIDADRLPEERARGMTIDVGFAHLDLEDGSSIDFVDVPGHDRLVGNMLVGAGEIDAVLLVVAADDGPRAQTLEHLELLDALGLRRAVAAITKVDAVEEPRVAEVEGLVARLLGRTAMAGVPIVPVSGLTGAGLQALRERLVELRDAASGDLGAHRPGSTRLPIDRAFAMRGRGAVVTGTLRGGSVRAGTELRLEPSEQPRILRVREVQVHHGRAEMADGGRTALNLAGIDGGELRRGQVLTAGEEVVSTDRLLVALRRPVALAADAVASEAPGAGAARAARATRAGGWQSRARTTATFHLWTDRVEATIGPATRRSDALEAGSDTAVVASVRLARPIAARVGARAVVRDPGSARVVAGVVVLDTHPPRGVSRRRATPARLAALAAAVTAGELRVAPTEGEDPVDVALVDLHGFRAGTLAPDLMAVLEAVAVESVGEAISLGEPTTVAELRARLGRELRRRAAVDRASVSAAAATVDRLIDRLVTEGRLARDTDRLVTPSRRAAVDDALAGAMRRLESLLDTNVPPPLAEAVRATGCPPAALRQLESSGRIVRVADDLAWSAGRYATLRELALGMARRGPLAPAAFRDAIGGNRRVALALLEDLGRRGVLLRTDAGHVPGPRA